MKVIKFTSQFLMMVLGMILVSSHVSSEESQGIEFEISSDAWPCFPSLYDLRVRDLYPIFSFPTGTRVTVSDQSDFLSSSDTRSECQEIFELADKSASTIEVMASNYTNFIPRKDHPWKQRISLEDFVSYHVSFEVWRTIIDELKRTHRLREAYLMSGSLVGFTHFYASVCHENPLLRDNYSVVCNYQTFLRRMDISVAMFDEFEADKVGQIVSHQVREATRETVNLSQHKFREIQPW